MAKNYRLQITLSEAEMRNLIRWAKWHGKPHSTYAGQIIGARLEANVPTIQQLMEDQAKAEGISVEELDKRWLAEADFGDSEEVE